MRFVNKSVPLHLICRNSSAIKGKMIEMKKLLAAICLCFSLVANAQNVEKVGNVELGLPYAEALSAMKAEWGNPSKENEQEVTYKHKTYKGFEFDEVIFRFKNGRFNEARFFVKVGSRYAAQKRMEELAKEMGKEKTLSKDVEEGGAWFYKGGRAPSEAAPLFTLCTIPRKGEYGMELRYGPFNFEKPEIYSTIQK